MKQFAVSADDNQHPNIQRMKEPPNSRGMPGTFDSSSGAVYVVRNCLKCHQALLDEHFDSTKNKT